MPQFPLEPEDGGSRARALAERMLRVVADTETERALAILFVSLICMGAGQSVMFAILPTLVRRLGLTEFQGSLPFVASATIWLFSSSYWGGKSDKWGRKPVILLGLIAFGISFASFAVIADLGIHTILAVAICYPLMIAARAIFGIFGSGASPAAQAYIADRTTRAERTSGVATLSAAFGLGTTIGPGIGSALVVFGLFAPFYFVALVAFASAATVWFLLPETTKPHVHAAQKRALKWHDRRIWPFIVFGLGISTAGAVPIQTIGYLFIDVPALFAETGAAIYRHRIGGRRGRRDVRAACRRAALQAVGADLDALGRRDLHRVVRAVRDWAPVRAARLRADDQRIGFRHGAAGLCGGGFALRRSA